MLHGNNFNQMRNSVHKEIWRSKYQCQGIVLTGFNAETDLALKSSYCNGCNQCDIIHCLGVVTQTSLIKLRGRNLLGVKNICTVVSVELWCTLSFRILPSGFNLHEANAKGKSSFFPFFVPKHKILIEKLKATKINFNTAKLTFREYSEKETMFHCCLLFIFKTWDKKKTANVYQKFY